MQPPETEPTRMPSSRIAGERARRPRARAEGLRDGEEPHAPARLHPVEGALQDVEIEALHPLAVDQGERRA